MTLRGKIMRFTMVLALLCLLVPSLAVAAGTATVTGKILNIRQQPSTNARILAQVKQGDKLTVLKQQGDWLQIKFGQRTGWVYKSLVSFTPVSAPVQVSNQAAQLTGAAKNYATVTGAILNVRQFPATTAKILGKVKKGTELPVLNQKGDWLQVKYGQQTGWVFKSLVSYTPPARPTAAPANQGPAAVQKTVSVTATTVNLRSGPGISYAKVGTARQGQELQVVAQQKGTDGKVWYKLNNGAWVASWLVQDKPKVTPVTNQPQEKPQPEPVPNLPPAEQGLYVDIRAVKEGEGTRIKVFSNAPISETLRLEQVDRQWKITLAGAKLLNPFPAEEVWPGLEQLQVQQQDGESAGIVLTAVYTSVYAPVLIPGQDGRSLELLVGLGRLQGRKIVLDPGHGGSDPGAIGAVLKVKEKDVNLAIARLVRRYLAEEGAQVVMTREGDTYPTLAERYTLANSQKADVFVSIHANSNTSSSVYGTATYYNNENRTAEDVAKRLKLAQLIQEEALKIPGRQAFGANNGVWVDSRGLAVLRGTVMPSVLVETAFLSNETEERILNDPAFQEQMARAIARGIIRYFTE